MRRESFMSEASKKSVEAHLEGIGVVVGNIGVKVEVSQMELIVLVNLAYLACMHIGSRDGEGEYCDEEYDLFIKILTQKFGNDKNPDGVNRLIQGFAGIISQEKIGKYLIQEEG